MRTICLLLLSTAAFAQNSTTDGDFAPVGGAFGEVIRVIAVIPPTTGDVEPGPCVVTMGFSDSTGATLGRPVSINLSPGQSAFTEFDFSTMATHIGQRFELRPVVTAAYTGSAAGCRLAAEIYDRVTLRTSTYQPIPVGDFSGVSPAIGDFGPIGAASGQVLRVNIAAVDPGPCRGTLSFANSNGAPVGGSLTANLAAGQAAFLDLPMAVTFPFSRVEIRPVVQVDSTAPWCIVSAELYDQLTGRNGTYVATPPPQGDRPIG
jgi:hypothetical protein